MAKQLTKNGDRAEPAGSGMILLAAASVMLPLALVAAAFAALMPVLTSS